jgi:uncharacterized protein YjiS (DUF1127 family)
MRLSPTAGHLSGHLGHASGSWLGLARSVWQAFRDHRAARIRYRQDVAQLEQFTDRELWDLGLSRSDIPSVARGVYRRD